MNNDELVYGIDQAGKYMGLVPKGTEYLHINNPPSIEDVLWDFAQGTWKHSLPFSREQELALYTIDSLCGSARLRFITDIPGQQAVYLTKLREAEQYLLDTTIGPYLLVESNLLGISLVDTANMLINLANTWNNIIGPKIEGIRRSNKIAINAATTLEELTNIRNLTESELNGI